MAGGGGASSAPLRAGCPEVNLRRWRLWRRCSLLWLLLLRSRLLQLPMSCELCLCRRCLVGYHGEVGRAGWGPGPLSIGCCCVFGFPLLQQAVRDPPAPAPDELAAAQAIPAGARLAPFAGAIACVWGAAKVTQAPSLRSLQALKRRSRAPRSCHRPR